MSIVPNPNKRFYQIGVHQWVETCCVKDEDEGEKDEETSGVITFQWRDSIKPIVTSISFISLNIWFIVCNLRHVFFISSVNAWLTGAEL